MSRPPSLLICGFGLFPEAPDNPAGRAIGRLSAENWAPPGASAAYAVLPTVWAKAPWAALEAMRAHGADAVLLVGVATCATAFRVETVARNRASTTHPDAEGALWPSPAIEPGGPAGRRVTADIDAVRTAIDAEGLPAELSADAGDYLCNFTLYRVLAEADGRVVAFLHVPPDGPALTFADIVMSVRAAAQALAVERR